MQIRIRTRDIAQLIEYLPSLCGLLNLMQFHIKSERVG